MGLALRGRGDHCGNMGLDSLGPQILPLWNAEVRT